MTKMLLDNNIRSLAIAAQTSVTTSVSAFSAMARMTEAWAGRRPDPPVLSPLPPAGAAMPAFNDPVVESKDPVVITVPTGYTSWGIEETALFLESKNLGWVHPHLSCRSGCASRTRTHSISHP